MIDDAQRAEENARLICYATYLRGRHSRAQERQHFFDRDAQVEARLAFDHGWNAALVWYGDGQNVDPVALRVARERLARLVGRAP